MALSVRGANQRWTCHPVDVSAQSGTEQAVGLLMEGLLLSYFRSTHTRGGSLHVLRDYQLALPSGDDVAVDFAVVDADSGEPIPRPTILKLSATVSFTDSPLLPEPSRGHDSRSMGKRDRNRALVLTSGFRHASGTLQPLAAGPGEGPAAPRFRSSRRRRRAR